MAEMTPQQFAEWTAKEINALHDFVVEQTVLMSLIFRALSDALPDERDLLAAIVKDRLAEVQHRPLAAQLLESVLTGLRHDADHTEKAATGPWPPHLRLLKKDESEL